ncbi:hypothetical protein, partial [Klebsiella pneumoniae]|uniref:hypothetical protein n=1 Tax=Klebsiella pneumoniae TaxID=573 RepID=UPI0025A093A9
FALVGGSPNIGNRVTIQVVCDVGAGTAKYPHLFGATNDFCNLYSSANGTILAFKVFNARSESGSDKAGKRVELSPSGSWSGKYANADWQSG